MNAVVVAGTDTDVGKTVFSAGLCAQLKAGYWKPVQAGLDGETDSEVVARLSGCTILPEAYRLRLPASPHLAAQSEGIRIVPHALSLPRCRTPLVIETSGGLMVPLNRQMLYLDVIARWGQPVILCARTRLGTINHTLLSLMALRSRGCRILGVVFIGDAEPEVEASILEMGGVTGLGRLPFLAELDAKSLSAAMERLDLDPVRAVFDQSYNTVDEKNETFGSES